MQSHVRDLLSRFQYNEQLRETAVFRILFGGEDPSQVMADLTIHNGYTLRSWVSLTKDTNRSDNFICCEEHSKAGCRSPEAAK